MARIAVVVRRLNRDISPPVYVIAPTGVDSQGNMRSTFEIPSMKAVESAVWNNAMNNHVYKSIELTGSSSIGIEDAVTSAVAKAHETVRNIQWVEIIETRGHVVDGKVAHWQVSLKIGFTLD